MELLRRFWSYHLTVMLIPHSNLPMVRVRASAPFVAFVSLLFSGVTLWAGFIVGHNLDYYITRLDNRVMRFKMSRMAGELMRAREELQEALDTDDKMRGLLGMNSGRYSKSRLASAGVGGPVSQDRDFIRHMTGNPAKINQAAIRRSIIDMRQESQRRLASFQEIAWYITNERSIYRSTPLGWPTVGRITSRFGYRFSPVNGGETGEFHSGIDIANAADTSIMATADGVVRRAGWAGGYGRMVLIDHEWGYSSAYGHTSKVLVREGEMVRRGQMIAYMGTTGRSTGDHCHYEVWRYGKPVNPMRFLQSKTQEDASQLTARLNSTRSPSDE